MKSFNDTIRGEKILKYCGTVSEQHRKIIQTHESKQRHHTLSGHANSPSDNQVV